MDWDMKLSSSTGHWDWDNSMLFSFRAAAAADIGKKPQYVGHCSDSHTEVLDNGFVYSAGPAPDSTLGSASAAAAASVGNFGYVSSSSRSSVSVDYYPPNSASAASSVDLCKIKVEAPSEPVADARNVKFLDLRSSTTTGSSQGTSSSSSRRRRTAAGAEDSSLSEKTSGNGKKAAEEELQQRAYATILDSKGKEGAASKEDTQLSLKLGKRTYFEDTSTSAAVFVAGSANKSNSCSSSSSSCAQTMTTVVSSSSASSVAAACVTPKKHRGPSQANQPPRCQVEGCNKDLSSCREYHRRHKVCELHSKSARVTVAGIEQRFCQQCSRFHVLSEFDDGKRSCRRRLAGHNERRRKPPPDNTALSSMRLATSTFDGRRPGLLIDRSALIHSCIYSKTLLDDRCNFRLGQGKVVWPRVVKAEDPCNLDSHYPSSGVNRQFQCNPYSRPNADRLLQMFQTSRIGSGELLSQSVHHYSGPATNQLPQSLTLATSSGSFSDIEVAPDTNSLQAVTESGRALSLLSNHSWGPSLRAPGSSSLDLASRPGIAMEHQYPHVNHSSIGLVSAEHPPSALNFMEKIPNGSSLANGILGIGNFESTVHGFRTGDGFRNSHEASSKDARRTIDLMHRSSQVQGDEPQGQSAIVQHSNGHFMEFQLMRSYESSVFETQQM